MLDLGPVSHDKAVAACGYEGGATSVTFDRPGDDVSHDQLLPALSADFKYDLRSSYVNISYFESVFSLIEGCLQSRF